jgi:ParB family transcriptional regulator, chromosome partitioning protein
MPEEVHQLSVDELQPNPLQPRGVITPDSLMDLVESIKEHGVLEPLVVAETPAGFQIIAGERRWRAAKLAGLPTVPALIKKTTPQGMLEMALVENVQRTDLNPVDRAKAFDRLLSEFNLTTTEIAQRIGKSAAFVSNTMRLLTLPDALKDGLLSGLVTEGHARALAAIEDTRLMVEAYKIILRESGSVRRAEELARRMKQGIPIAAASAATTFVRDDQYVDHQQLDAMAQEIQSLLGDRSKVSINRSRAETRLVIKLKGTISDTEDQLQLIYRALTGK